MRKMKVEDFIMRNCVEGKTPTENDTSGPIRICRYWKSHCLDDDCIHPEHPFSVPADADIPLYRVCSVCKDFEEVSDFA